MKKYFCLLLFFALFKTSQAQINPPKIFIGIDGFISKDYENNMYTNFNVGLELFSVPYFAPEVEFEHFTGSLDKVKDLNRLDPNLAPEGFRDYSFKANIYSLNPKLILGKADWSICLMPKYSFGDIHTRGVYYKLNESESLYELQKVDEHRTSTSYFTFGVGLNFMGFKSDKLSMLISFKVTGFNTSKAYEKIDFSDYGIPPVTQSSETFGMGFRIYYDPFKKS